jgi:hypothetical protein
MISLTDSKGREWPLSIDHSCIDRIWQRTGVDLCDAHSRRVAASNNILLLDVMFSAWLPLCEDRGITRPDFHRLGMPFLTPAVRLFVSELADWLFRNGQQDVAKAIWNGLSDPHCSIEPEQRMQYARRAEELNAINSERAIDEKLAELHRLLDQTRTRGT